MAGTVVFPQSLPVSVGLCMPTTLEQGGGAVLSGRCKSERLLVVIIIIPTTNRDAEGSRLFHKGAGFLTCSGLQEDGNVE